MDAGSSLKAGARGKLQVWGGCPLKEKNKYKIRSNGNVSLELEKSQVTPVLEIHIPSL